MLLHLALFAFVVSVAAAPSQSLGLASMDSGTALAWPANLPGHGNLTVNMTAIAQGTNSTALLNLITSHDLPDTFTISKQIDFACDGRVNFNNITDMVSGDLCLGSDIGYADVVEAFQSSKNTDVFALPSEHDTCGCFCACSMACMALLLFAPLCWAGCAACPAGSG